MVDDENWRLKNEMKIDINMKLSKKIVWKIILLCFFSDHAEVESRWLVRCFEVLIFVIANSFDAFVCLDDSYTKRS